MFKNQSDFWVISDTHFCHKKIAEFEPIRQKFGGTDDFIITQYLSLIRENDKVLFLGDIVFSPDKNFDRIMADIPGEKYLIMGNHDYGNPSRYEPYFKSMAGAMKTKDKLLFTHYPVHPSSLDGKINVHGHIHSGSVPDVYSPIPGSIDDSYVNVSIENSFNITKRWFSPIHISEIRDFIKKREEARLAKVQGLKEGVHR